MKAYFTLTTRVTVQRISEATGIAFAAPVRPTAVWNAYSGLVPISPKTTPSAANQSREGFLSGRDFMTEKPYRPLLPFNNPGICGIRLA